MKWLPGALAVALILTLLLGYLATAVVGHCKDNLGGPVMGLAGVLALVLGVGLAGVLTRRPRVPDQDEPPSRNPLES